MNNEWMLHRVNLKTGISCGFRSIHLRSTNSKFCVLCLKKWTILKHIWCFINSTRFQHSKDCPTVWLRYFSDKKGKMLRMCKLLEILDGFSIWLNVRVFRVELLRTEEKVVCKQRTHELYILRPLWLYETFLKRIWCMVLSREVNSTVLRMAI